MQLGTHKPSHIIALFMINLISAFIIIHIIVAEWPKIFDGIQNIHTVIVEIAIGIMIALIAFRRSDSENTKLEQLINDIKAIEIRQSDYLNTEKQRRSSILLVSLRGIKSTFVDFRENYEKIVMLSANNFKLYKNNIQKYKQHQEKLMDSFHGGDIDYYRDDFFDEVKSEITLIKEFLHPYLYNFLIIILCNAEASMFHGKIFDGTIKSGLIQIEECIEEIDMEMVRIESFTNSPP